MRNRIAIDFDEFVNTVNEKGKNDAKILVREKYNLSFEQVKRRLFQSTSYYFDSVTRLYKKSNQEAANTEFLSIEELDKMKPNETIINGIGALTGASSNLNFDEIVRELIKDRLMELSKYVSIDHCSRRLIINTNILNHDGFSLVEI